MLASDLSRPHRCAGMLMLLRAAAMATIALAANAAMAFGFDDVAAIAKGAAATPYRAPQAALPPELAALDYDQYRDIRFRNAGALWRNENLPFEAMFFHLGHYQKLPVSLNEITPTGVHPIAFDPSDFDYGHNKLSPSTWGDVGYAGFRLVYPLNKPTYKDELVAFLGASYFRAIGAGQLYGLSARGLALDTAGGQGEEFPRFTTFWLERPAPGATEVTLYALLDSVRATGAYRFTFHPGTQTLVDVQMRIFLRAGVATLGVAPLTSMYHHGENAPSPNHFRPEVHDSDGLMVATTGAAGASEWLWRPLVNPKRPLVSSFQVAGQLQGFGLMQRDRAFSSYEDTEARYERRPSVWITPVGDWGSGRVELVQLHATDETDDNIVAYWVPARAPAPGEPLDLSYRMAWQGDEQQHPPNGWAVQSRTGQGFRPLPAGQFQYVVDFTGPSLAALPADASVEAVATAVSNARVIERNAFHNEVTGTWRMTLRIARLDPSQSVELRAFLQHGNHALTETWTNLIEPE